MDTTRTKIFGEQYRSTQQNTQLHIKNVQFDWLPHSFTSYRCTLVKTFLLQTSLILTSTHTIKINMRCADIKIFFFSSQMFPGSHGVQTVETWSLLWNKTLQIFRKTRHSQYCDLMRLCWLCNCTKSQLIRWNNVRKESVNYFNDNEKTKTHR